jgi:hypothetical protein
MNSKIAFLFITISLLFSCESKVQNPEIAKEVYVKAQPIGPPTIMEIGASGGIIEVDLNEAKIIFPPNTFNEPTMVSIQPISNTKNNFGEGIRISSDYKNITIALKYPLNGLDSTDFDVYYSQWLQWDKVKNKIINTKDHTISFIQNPKLSNSFSKNAKISTHVFDYLVGKSVGK